MKKLYKKLEGKELSNEQYIQLCTNEGFEKQMSNIEEILEKANYKR